MNYPPEGLNVLIKHPNNENWELSYYKYGKWWRGIANCDDDEIVDYEPFEWKFYE